MELLTLPANKWVGSNIVTATFGLTEEALNNYRQKVWQQGKHYLKIGTSGEASLRKAKIVYNIAEINTWIESYPQQ
ncbi:hypothetical protein TW81_02065 [Vibrio galatheae]|uniref:Excisionase n=1 Tax=Vibrio galatheae TaxID=579748 RepID=A0A0F4NPI1_9VIBR|nr:excisionase family protein [Vibrio galatheae]KJY84804.1 hypothetical protein TW81_02065 [Vibrio galatheae]